MLSCYDRMIVTGTLPGACYAGGMTSFLNFRHIKIFDYAKAFADPWRERIRKIYDKFKCILRIETTTNDVS